MTFLAVLCIGAGIGFVSGAFGKGGSALATPLLHLAGVPAFAALASPLPATIPSTLLASRSYARADSVDRRVVRSALFLALPATVAGALCTRWIPGERLVIATDFLVLFLGLRVLTHKESSLDEPRYGARLVAVLVATGAVSGLLGNSGGFLLAPLFMSVLHMPVKRALGTSLVVSALIAVPGTIVHAWLGHVDWALTLAFGLASVPLASVGAQVALRMRSRSLTLAFGTGLTTIAGGLLLFAR